MDDVFNQARNSIKIRGDRVFEPMDNRCRDGAQYQQLLSNKKYLDGKQAPERIRDYGGVMNYISVIEREKWIQKIRKLQGMSMLCSLNGKEFRNDSEPKEIYSLIAEAEDLISRTALKKILSGL